MPFEFSGRNYQSQIEFQSRTHSARMETLCHFRAFEGMSWLQVLPMGQVREAASNFQSQFFWGGSLRNQGGNGVRLLCDACGVSIGGYVLGWCQPYDFEICCDKGLTYWIWGGGLQVTRKSQEKYTMCIRKIIKGPYVWRCELSYMDPKLSRFVQISYSIRVQVVWSGLYL